MGRPAKFDREEAVERAMQMFWSEGYEQASVKAISEMLGITRSSFYNAFSSREALFAQVLSRYVATSPDAPLHAAVQGPVLPLFEAVFRDLCHRRASDPDGRGCIIINAVAETCPSEADPGLGLACMILGSAKRLEALIQLAQSQGEIARGKNPQAIALAMQNLMVGLNVLCKVVRDEAQLLLVAMTTLQGLGVVAADCPVWVPQVGNAAAP